MPKPGTALRSRIWVDTFTELAYRIKPERAESTLDADGLPPSDCTIQVSYDDGGHWHVSGEFRRVADFIRAIQERRLSMHFEPQEADLEGMKYVMGHCQKELGDKEKFQDKQRKGELRAYAKIAQVVADYLSRARAVKPEFEPEVRPAVVAADEGAEEVVRI